MRKRATVAVGMGALLSVTTLSGIVGTTTAGASSIRRTVLTGTEVSAAARQHPVGAVSKSGPVDFQLVLRLRDPAAAQALVQSVSSPGSPAYRRYVTAAQWEARFSPAGKAVAQATGWLRSEGFKVSGVSNDRITISASGTAAQVEKAFGTGLENYKVGGHTVRFTTTKMSVPAALAGTVVGAMGVNESIATAAVAGASASTSAAGAGKFPPAPPAFVTAPPCSSYYGQKVKTVTPHFGGGYPAKVPYEVCGYKPGQFRSGYSLTSKNTGKGVTVAIIDAYGSATIAGDASRYFKTEDPSIPFAAAHFSQDDAFPFNNEALCGASGWADEQAIDVESVHSTAPDAHILYVGAKSCLNTGLFNAEQKVIDKHLADVVTNSWGDDAGDLLDDAATRTAYDDIFMMADSSGMTIQFSSGDNGDNFNLFGFSSADYPAESPYVTAVGGTSLKVAADGRQTGQVGWATGRSFLCTANIAGDLPGCTSKTVKTWEPVSYDGGSGGFTSYNYPQPSYQAKVVPSSLALRNEALDGPVPMRVEPDISMDADPSTGFRIGLHQIFADGKDVYSTTRYGGTSLASPLLAGVIADADQASIAAGGSPVGFINPAIYRVDKRAGAIDDIVPAGKQAEYRVDHAFTYVPGAKGTIQQFRELTYEGIITYCDETGNCASRPNTLSTAKGYDSMTGLGAIGPSFIMDLSKS